MYAASVDRDGPDPRVCLIALGGYGRGELCPHSDVDILFLTENGPREAIAAAVRFCWDIGLDLGCVSRSLGECASILGQDWVTDTAFLEARFICGSVSLHHRLLRRIVRPYFRDGRMRHVRKLRLALRASLFSPETALYRIEPDIKNGPCCLRDCHRLLWAERIRAEVTRIDELATKSYFTSEQAALFGKAYDFFLELRIRLHERYGRRIDILELGAQQDIAQRLGMGPAGAGALLEQFFVMIRDVRLFLLTFIEQNEAGHSVWSRLQKRLGAVDAFAGIGLFEGYLFSKGPPGDLGPEDMVRIFRAALSHQATLCVELRNRLRAAASLHPAEDFRSPAISAVFREILSWEGPVGPIVQIMHETGVLAKIVPPFKSVICKVEYDSYHEFTVDQHTLLAFAGVDALGTGTDKVIRGVRKRVKNIALLRLALLLHDLGKGSPGDHVRNSTAIAETITERLGLSDEECGRVLFLVHHHLLFSDLSQREPEPQMIRETVAIIGDRENLDLLYLLTVLDIRNVGAATWTGWKAFQLESLHALLAAALESTADSGATVRHGGDESFAEDRALHAGMLSQLRGPNDLVLAHDDLPGFERLTVCAVDRPGFLSDILGCLSSEGYNILSARISSIGKNVLDVFYMEPPDIPIISPKQRLDNIRRKWEALGRGGTGADALIAERTTRYPPKPLRSETRDRGVMVSVDNKESERYTVVRVRVRDNFGLVHRIACFLSQAGVNIRGARLSTRIDLANDVFYVTDPGGRKLGDPGRCENLVAGLRSVLADSSFLPHHPHYRRLIV